MNPKILALLKYYDEVLVTRDIPEINMSHTLTPIGDQRLAHVRWMIREMVNLATSDKFKQERTVNRWLGFIQGVLYCHGVFTINHMRDQSRKLYD